MFVIMELEPLNRLLTQVVLFIHLLLKDVLKKDSKRKGLRKGITMVYIVSHGQQEDSLPVLRNSVILGIHNLPIGCITIVIDSLHPLDEGRIEFLAYQSLDILKQTHLRSLDADGLLALP